MDSASAQDEGADMGRLVPLATVVVAFAAGGCGGSDGRLESDGAREAAAGSPSVPLHQLEVRTPAVIAPAETARVPDGFRVRRLSDVGLQIALPRGWLALARRDAVFPGAAQTLLRVDGSLRASLAALSLPDSPMKLLVLAPVRGGKFPATVSIVVSGVGRAPAAFSEWAPDVRRSLAASAKPVGGKVASRRVALAVGDGLRMAFEQHKAGRRFAVIQYAAMSGGQALLLRLTTTPRLLPTVIRDFDALVGTLAALPGSAPAAPATAGTTIAPAA
jgi:hypothetical protein